MQTVKTKSPDICFPRVYMEYEVFNDLKLMKELNRNHRHHMLLMLL